MKLDLLTRLRNYGLWVSVASLILMLLQNFGVHIVADQYNTIVNSILGVLVLLGVVSDPTTANKGFKDD